VVKVNINSKDASLDPFEAAINSVHTRIDYLQADMQKLKIGMKAPTHPVYDSTNFPDNPNRGQIVRDINDPGVLWVYGEDDHWHQIGGANLPCATASAIDVTVPTNTDFFKIPICPPQDITDPVSFYLSNSDGATFDSLGGENLGINILRSGAYLGFLSTYSAAAPGGVRTVIADLAPTTGATSLDVGNYNDSQAFTEGGQGTKASRLVFYVYSPTDIVPANFGMSIWQNSGSNQYYHQSNITLVRIADGIEGFLP
jgi:hypothetical protein